MSPAPRPRGRPRNQARNATKSTIQSLDRALDVLEILSEQGGMTLSRLASDMRQSPSTVYRVLTTLESRQIVEADRDQSWHIGPAAFRLGSSFLRRTGLIERSRPFMRALMERTGETANLGVERGGQVLFVSQVETHETIRAFFAPGTQSQMHASGIGKALLAQFSERALAKYLRQTSLTRFTDKTLSNPDDLREELSKIRRRGYAYDNEERTPGMRCIAAPVLDQYGEAVAGISVSGPTTRMSGGTIQTTIEAVISVAREVSQSLGAPSVGAQS